VAPSPNPTSASDAPVGSRRVAARGDAGFTMMEVLLAMAVMAVVGTSVMAAVYTLVRSDAQQQSLSESAVVARNFADALDAAPYQDCATITTYSPEMVGLALPASATVTVTAVTYWNGTAPPAGANPSPAQWATAFDTTCPPDRGLQRITFQARSTAGTADSTTTRSVLKRFNGALPEPEPDPPPGGRTCVVNGTVNTSDVASTWVNEIAWAQTTNYSSGPNSREMNILYLAGSRRYSYLRFAISAGMTCDNGATLPAGADIYAAEVRLYTFGVGGAPACTGGGDSCWHVMERVGGVWAQSSLNWVNQPCPTGYGQSCQPGGVASTILFQHGAPWWLAAYQRIQAPQLLSDVRGFFDGSLTNGGWVIKEACAETYKKACGSGTPGFQMASSRAANADQRPRLTLWFRWS